MKGILTFIGGVAVGILAVTGVYAWEEDGGNRPVDFSDEEMEIEDGDEEESEESGKEEEAGER